MIPNTPSLTDSFYIHNIEIPGRVLLAPMDGFTDSPFRLSCQKHGASLCPSEFINGIDVVNGHPYLKFRSYFEDAERPFCYQLYDDNPDRLLKSALLLAERKPDLLDINMGCSARNVSNRGAGAGLLKTPHKIATMISSLVSATSIPITAKIRLGWDDNSRNYREIVHILQENGISAITVHARTRKQEYKGLADWDAIAEIKQIVKVPVIGNGDVHSLIDAESLIQKTGCDAVMIGRAALGNPWVFSGVNKNHVAPDEFLATMRDHLNAMVKLYSPRLGTILFRRHLSKYLKPHALTLEEKQFMFAIEDEEELIQFLSKLINKYVEEQV